MKQSKKNQTTQTATTTTTTTTTAAPEKPEEGGLAPLTPETAPAASPVGLAADAPKKSKKAAPEKPEKAAKADKVVITFPAFEYQVIDGVKLAAATTRSTKTAFTRVTIAGTDAEREAARKAVQTAAASFGLSKIADALTDAEAAALDADGTPETRKAAEALAESLRAVKVETIKKYPAAVGYDRNTPENAHAVIVAAALFGQRPGLKLDRVALSMAEFSAAASGALKNWLCGASVKITDAERESVTVLKADIKKAVEPYCVATQISKAFNMRVTDEDIINLYRMSGQGYSRKNGSYRARKNWEAALLMFFYSKLLRDAAEAPAPEK